jgi:hypothetical protein
MQVAVQTLYTMGYLAGRADKKLRDFITMGIPVVDVRYTPDSRHWQWTKASLVNSQYSLRYSQKKIRCTGNGEKQNGHLFSHILAHAHSWW